MLFAVSGVCQVQSCLQWQHATWLARPPAMPASGASNGTGEGYPALTFGRLVDSQLLEVEPLLASSSAASSPTHDVWMDVLNLNNKPDPERFRSLSPIRVPRSRSPIWDCDSPDPQEPQRSRSRTRSPWRTRIVVTPALRRMWEESMNEDMVYGLEAEYNILYEPEVHHSEWFYLRQTTGPNGEELPIVFDDHVGGCLRQKLDVLVEMHALDSFYIGATVDPRTRWIGRPATLERKEMPGHSETWGVQVMLAFTSRGPVLEDSLIKYAQSVYRETCRNKAPA